MVSADIHRLAATTHASYERNKGFHLFQLLLSLGASFLLSESFLLQFSILLSAWVHWFRFLARDFTQLKKDTQTMQVVIRASNTVSTSQNYNSIFSNGAHAASGVGDLLPKYLVRKRCCGATSALCLSESPTNDNKETVQTLTLTVTCYVILVTSTSAGTTWGAWCIRPRTQVSSRHLSSREH